jgi:hypothetical protein
MDLQLVLCTCACSFTRTPPKLKVIPPVTGWRLRELALEALAKLLHHQCTAGATAAGLQAALRLLALDPLQEPALLHDLVTTR